MRPRSSTRGWTALLIAALSTSATGCAAARREAPVTSAAAAPADAQHEREELESLLSRGGAALAQNRFEEARAAFRAAAAESSRDARPLVGLARVEAGLGRRQEAIELLGQALALQETAEARALRGRQLAVARSFDEAARDLLRAVELDPQQPEAWAVLAAVQVNRGDEVEAHWAFDGLRRVAGAAAPDRFWTQLLSLPPDPVHPQESLDRCTRGRVALYERRWIDAHAEHLNGLRYSPRFHWCAAGLAEATWRAGDARSAERVLRTVIASERAAPLAADARAKLAEVLAESGRPAEAIDLARAALAVRGDRAAILDSLARACDAAEDAGCAREAYERVLAQPHAPDELRRRAEARVAAMR